MSTYTDLHNRLKENVTIIHRPGTREDGMTPQLVKFMNPENEYHGRFFGTLRNANGTLSGVQISGATIVGAKISDATVNGVDLDTIGEQIQILTGDFEDLEDKFNKLCADDFGDLVKCQHNLITCVQNSCDAIYKIAISSNSYAKGFANDIAQLKKNVKELSDDNSLNAISALLKKDMRISCNYVTDLIANVSSDLNGKINNTNIDLYDLSVNLNAKLDNSIDDVKDLLDISCNSIIQDLAVEKNDRIINDATTLSIAKEYTDSQILMNKHYEFNSVKVQDSYKFQVKDYAINTIEIQPDCAKITNIENNSVIGAVRNIISNTGVNNIVQTIVVRFFDSATEVPDNLKNIDISLDRNVPLVNGLTWKPNEAYHYDDPTCIADDNIIINGVTYTITNGTSDLDIILMSMPEEIADHSREFVVSFKPSKADIVPTIAVKFNDTLEDSENSNIVYLWHGDEITDNTIQVATGEKTTLKFQEVSKNVFVVTDFDDSLLSHDIAQNREHVIKLEEQISSLTARLAKLESLISATFAWDENDLTSPAKLVLKSPGSINYYLDVTDDGMLEQQEI